MVWQAGRVVAAFSETVCMVLPPHVRPRAHGLVFGVRNGRLSRKAGGVNVRAFPSELFRTSSGKNRGQDIRRSMHQSCQSCKSCQITAVSELFVPYALFSYFEHQNRRFCQPNHPRFPNYLYLSTGHGDTISSTISPAATPFQTRHGPLVSREGGCRYPRWRNPGGIHGLMPVTARLPA